MTPIREEEISSTTSANADAPILQEDANVGVQLAANTTAPMVDEEEVKTPSSASTTVPVKEEAKLDSEMVVIGYCFQVPFVKWHSKLEMMSKAGLAQKQYEQKVVAQGCVGHFICCLPNLQFVFHHDITPSS